MRELIVTALKPLFVEIGKAHIPFSRKKMKLENVVKLKKIVKPGDVILVRTSGELTNWFIPGPYKHAAMYFGDDFVVESTGAGVHSTSLYDFIMTKDYVSVFTPRFCSDQEAEEAANWAWMQRGRPYDYEFRSNNESFYCFELTYAAYNEVLKQNNPWKLRETFGEPTVVADDFLKATNKWFQTLEM